MKVTKSKTAKTSSQKRSPKKGDAVPSFVDASARKDISPEIAHPVVPAETQALLSEVTKPMLAKVRRAFRKAGREASEAAQLEYAEELIAAGVPILSRSSSRIAQVLKGDRTLEDLKVSKARKS